MKPSKPIEPSSDLSRRTFLRGSSVATLMAMMGGIPIRAEDDPQARATLTAKVDHRPVRCAVIGCGPRGRELLQTLARLPKGPVVALCDTYEPMLRRAAALAPQAVKYSDYRQVLANQDVQAVLLATPSHLHREIALAALQAGKHLYCEAPLATTVDDARAIALAAKAAFKVHVQAGLQNRADPQLKYLLDYIRTGVLGATVMARSQWHKRQQWRCASPNPEREQELNWRLNRAQSSGLMGEIGIHHVDLATRFLRSRPVAVSGFGGVLGWGGDGREVPDTIQAIFEYPDGVQFVFDCTVTNSFDDTYDLFYGTESAILWRDRRAWMFKESDARLLGWQVYARKEPFYKENGIVLDADATKLTAQAATPATAVLDELSAIERALIAFLNNAYVLTSGVEDYAATFGAENPEALKEYLASLRKKLLPCAGYQEGFEATVIALKANEAIVTRQRVPFPSGWFELG